MQGDNVSKKIIEPNADASKKFKSYIMTLCLTNKDQLVLISIIKFYVLSLFLILSNAQSY